MAKRFDLPLLAQIPIIQNIMESGDSGVPIALKDGGASVYYDGLAKKLAAIIS